MNGFLIRIKNNYIALNLRGSFYNAREHIKLQFFVDLLMKFTFKKALVITGIIIFFIFGGFQMFFVIIMIIVAFATGQTFI